MILINQDLKLVLSLARECYHANQASIKIVSISAKESVNYQITFPTKPLSSDHEVNQVQQLIILEKRKAEVETTLVVEETK